MSERLADKDGVQWAGRVAVVGSLLRRGRCRPPKETDGLETDSEEVPRGKAEPCGRGGRMKPVGWKSPCGWFLGKLQQGVPVLYHGPRIVMAGQVCVQGSTRAQGTRNGSVTSTVAWEESSDSTTRWRTNYTGTGRSLWKRWWRSVAMLARKPLVGSLYRGERPIESASGWFPPKDL